MEGPSGSGGTARVAVAPQREVGRTADRVAHDPELARLQTIGGRLAAARLVEPRVATSIPKDLLDLMPPAYHALPDGTLAFRNRAFETIAEAAYPGFRAAVAGEAAPAAPSELRQVFARLDAGETAVNLRQTIEIDGAIRHLRSTHVRLSEGGVSAGYCGVYTDVTLEADAVLRSTRTEARFQDVIRSASDWVWETDAHLNVAYASNRISEVLETPPASLTGKHLFALGEFEDTPGNGPPRPDLAATLTPFRGRIFLMPDKRGRVRRISLTGVPVFDERTGAFVGYRGTGTDVTLQHEAELRAGRTQKALEASLGELRERNVQLDGALKQAQSAARAKTDFLSKMSHELRTPLNAIIGFAEMSIQQVFGSLNGRYLEYFRDIHGAAHHLLNIINDILDAVNVDAARISVAPEPIRLSQVLAQARSIVAVRAEQQRINISAIGLPDEFVVMADPGRLRQILVNLLNNAVKFTPPGGAVGADMRHVGSDMVECTVWDTGIGIPPEEHERIFESFHQVGSDILSTPTEGTGLGLTISRQLAQLMGGDITVDSTPGRGSRFTVRLPRARPRPVGQPPKPA